MKTLFKAFLVSLLLVAGLVGTAWSAPQPVGVEVLNLQTDDYAIWIGAVTQSGDVVPAKMVTIRVDNTCTVEFGPHPGSYRDPDVAAPPTYDGQTIDNDVEYLIPLSTTEPNFITCSAMYLIIRDASGIHSINLQITVEY